MSFCAVLLFSGAAGAMEIRQFDNMDDRDQAAYVGLLVKRAEKVLTNEGRIDPAAQVDKLFLTKPAGDKNVIGYDGIRKKSGVGACCRCPESSAGPECASASS